MAEQNREILKVEHLKKYFPVPNGMLHAVDDISFTIEQGKTLGVVRLRQVYNGPCHSPPA